ncbi:hypothetical protein CkaCkLH20_12907 [Colletotrichum karsti]|uniref:Carcinoembryonic antigen-related cell adhesion molecule 1 n=1 Tax=Colletotrichum karsti TaxID=1095194 RepID=A0A9P6LEJ5_9PEZI|nr:uncharacterized protein CkaCkLH20_12907 [Colletotrichum karsti]KAF9869610.1 hypothetical protein CkaCkLH20_12907 [Colletotrichum karsti]
MSVYATPPADGAFYSDLWCAGANTETELFLSIEATSTGSPTGRATSTATNTSAAADSGSNSGSSKAWIAGVVIGPLAGIALGVLVFFMLRRRWKKKHDATTAAATAPGAQNGDGYGMQQDWSKTQTPSGYSHQQWQTSPHPPPLELDTNRFAGPPREMDTANATASELDAEQVPRR